VLLLLDNFEHLLDAASGVAETVRCCPHLTVLVTSREPLRVDGEWEVAVDPMRELEAVDLFIQRASAVNSHFEANGEVADICRRLDYLPLAIELAVPARLPSGSGRCARRSPGVTTYSARQNKTCLRA
jgi:predicted ATPase